MTEPDASTNPASSFLDRHHFLLRRLHSLSGIVPVGVFLIEHLITNSAILLGPEEFQKDIDFIWSLPGLLMMEVFGIWLPIAFHAGLGVVYSFGGRANVAQYRYVGNGRYTLQRVTGMVALIYIFLHLATTRWGWNIFGWHTPFDPQNAAASTAHALQFAWWVPWFYLIGVLSVVFHFANGLWTAAITWGLTLSVNGMRRWGYVCASLGVVLAVLGVGSIYCFSVMPVEQTYLADSADVEPAVPSGLGVIPPRPSLSMDAPADWDPPTVTESVNTQGPEAPPSTDPAHRPGQP